MLYLVFNADPFQSPDQVAVISTNIEVSANEPDPSLGTHAVGINLTVAVALPKPAATTFTKLAHTGTPIPGGRGTFGAPLSGGFGARAFDFPALQNGSPDGIALVDPDDNVVHFISYEGTFSATDGPAKGMVAPDIGVFEPDNTPIGQSLQLTGTGCVTDGFIWSGPAPATRGALNVGQTVACR